MNVKAVVKTFEPLLGQPCWGLYYHRNMNLSMSFGKPKLYVNQSTRSEPISNREPQRRQTWVRGEWWLWIYRSAWRLFENGRLTAATGYSSRWIDRAAAQLEGRRLVGVEVHSSTGATRFAFERSWLLECRRCEREGDAEFWMLFRPSGFVLSVHGNGTSSNRRAAEVEANLLLF
jgi:hypothetical protein